MVCAHCLADSTCSPFSDPVASAVCLSVAADKTGNLGAQIVLLITTKSKTGQDDLVAGRLARASGGSCVSSLCCRASRQAQDIPKCRPSNDLELQGSQQFPHSCPRSQPSPHDSYPAPASPESGLSRCSPAKTSDMILGRPLQNKNAGPFVKIPDKALLLCVSLPIVVFCICYSISVLWEQTLLGAWALPCNEAQSCVPDAGPPHAQVTGAEGSSEFKGRTGSGLPRTQPGEVWVPGTPSTVPTDCLQNANTKIK